MRKQCVAIDGVKSRYVSVISGLPQGTVLAALLFLIFINDLPSSVTQSFTGIFCDDTLLAKEINNQDVETFKLPKSQNLKIDFSKYTKIPCPVDENGKAIDFLLFW